MLPPYYKTERLILKPYSQSDEDRFVEMSIDKTSVEFMGGSSGIESEERALFKKVLELYKRNDKRWFWIWGIYINKALCGHLEMKETENTNKGEVEIVYMMHPEFRKLGIMTEVLAFLKQNQATWQKKFIATLDEENKYSMKLLNKWGIEKEETIIDEETGDSFLKVYLSIK